MEPDVPVEDPALGEQPVTILCRPEAGKVSTGWIPGFVSRVAAVAGARRRQVTVVLAGDDEVRELNRRYREKDRATDILSFPADDEPGSGLLGEVIIAVGKAGRQAAQRHHSLEVELRYLLIHGVLHLMGMDHETDDGNMDEEERRIRALLRDELRAGPEHSDGAGR